MAIPRTGVGELIALFIGQRPATLLLSVGSGNARCLRHALPTRMGIFCRFRSVPRSRFGLVVTIAPCVCDTRVPVLYFRPTILRLKVNYQGRYSPSNVTRCVRTIVRERNLYPFSLTSLGAVRLGGSRPLLRVLRQQ